MSSAGAAAYPGAAASMVGRQQELQQLGQGLEQARSGQRQLVVISGEAGMGKTTLVDTFMDHYIDDNTLRFGRGQCLEHYGEGEAYLPVLEALGRLGRAPGGDGVIAVLRQVAPSWLVHLPALVPEVERQQRQAQETTRDQMLRELVEALEALTVETPLVLLFEDLHWSDPSTIDMLASLARRPEAAKLLVVGTYRPMDAQVQSHPLVACLQELRAHGRAVELARAGFDVEEVAAYGLSRLGAPLTSEMTALLHQRSAGNALFLVHLLEYLLQQGDIVRDEGRWTLRDAPEAWQRLPGEVHLLLARQLDQMPPAVQQVLEVASVVGETFMAAAVAAGTEHEIEEIDRLCATVVRLGGFAEADGLASWPDGTVSGQYRFRHALVRQVAYERIGAGPRAVLHGRIGECLEKAYGTRAGEIAATLAVHFIQSQDVLRAIQYLHMVTEQALFRKPTRRRSPTAPGL